MIAIRDFIVLLLTVLCPISGFAWGASGHRFISDTAVEELPAPLKTFFQINKVLFKDKAAIEPPGNHFIDIDYYPEFFSHTFPPDVNVLIARYGSSVVTQYGMGPWTAVDHYNALRDKFATANGVSDWTNLLATAGAMAHYIEDLHNPMHLALNYNGQYTGQTGLHSRYETTLIGYRLTAGLRLVTNGTACVYHPSLIDAIFSDIDLIYPYNKPLLDADLSAFATAGERSSTYYYQHLWDDGCSSFTATAMQKAADMVASALYSAWREAGFPQPSGVPVSTALTIQPLTTTLDTCRFRVLGEVGQKLDIQTTTDLHDWTLQVSLTNLDGRMEIIVPRSNTESHRYYRVKLAQ